MKLPIRLCPACSNLPDFSSPNLPISICLPAILAFVLFSELIITFPACNCFSVLQLLSQLTTNFLVCKCFPELLLLLQLAIALSNCHFFPTALPNCYCFPAIASILHLQFALMHGKPCTTSLPLPFHTLSSAKKLVNLRSIYYNNNIFILKLKSCLS
jgi:hypothetical protein